jgi:hypothetical protein
VTHLRSQETAHERFRVAGPGADGPLLIRMFMDDVAHNAAGNQLTMVKRRAAERA